MQTSIIYLLIILIAFSPFNGIQVEANRRLFQSIEIPASDSSSTGSIDTIAPTTPTLPPIIAGDDTIATCVSCPLSYCNNPAAVIAIPDRNNDGQNTICSQVESGLTLLLNQANNNQCKTDITSLLCDTAVNRSSNCYGSTPEFFKPRCESLLATCVNPIAQQFASSNNVCSVDMSNLPRIPGTGAINETPQPTAATPSTPTGAAAGNQLTVPTVLPILFSLTALLLAFEL